MSRSTLATFALIALAACDQSTAPESRARPLTSDPSPAVVANTKVDLPLFVVGNFCAPAEPVLINDGAAHLKAQLTVTPSGNGMLRLSVNTQGVKGVGLFSDDRYQLHLNASFSVNGGSDRAFVLDAAVKFQAIRQGAADNMEVDGRIHLTANANGDLTSFHFEPLGLECKG